jgi:hypothetical protein
MLTKVKNVLDITADTVADLASTEHKTGSIQLLGFHTKGDGGGGVFFWDATKDKSEHNGGTIIDPSIAGLVANWEYTQNLYFSPAAIGQGCWVREYSGAVSVKWFGAKGDGTTDDTLAIQQALDSKNDVYFSSDTYAVSDKILITNDKFVNFNGAVIDGKLFSVGSGIDAVLQFLGDDTQTLLPTISTDIVAKDLFLNFTSNHGLVAGDWVLINNPSDYSYSSFRPGYKAGEYSQVQEVVSSTEVKLNAPIWAEDGYATSDINVYKLNLTSFKTTGGVTVKTPNFNEAIRAISIANTKNMDISKFTGIAHGGVIGIVIGNSVNVSGTGVTAIQSGTIAVDYGLAIVSCQHVSLDGYFSARRHGFTTAESEGIGAVNRDLRISGFFTSTALTHGLDTHGNTEHCQFSGTITGGLQLRGNHFRVLADITADDDGRCVRFSEMSGFSYNLSGCKFIGSDKNSAWGLVNIGYSTTVVSDEANAKGGVLDFSNITINAPLSDKLFWLNKKAATTDNISIDFSGLKIEQAQTGAGIIIDSDDALPNYKIVNFSNVSNIGTDITTSISNTNKVIARVKGKVSLTTAASNRVTSTVNYGISFGDEPPVLLAQYGSTGTMPTNSGTVTPVTVTNSNSTTSGVVGLGTPDNSNFTSGNTRTVFWVAENS